MKTLLTAALAAMIAMPAFAQDKPKTAADMPASVKAEIKAKCAKKWPDSYSMQDTCIEVEVDAWVNVVNF